MLVDIRCISDVGVRWGRAFGLGAVEGESGDRASRAVFEIERMVVFWTKVDVRR